MTDNKNPGLLQMGAGGRVGLAALAVAVIWAVILGLLL